MFSIILNTDRGYMKLVIGGIAYKIIQAVGVNTFLVKHTTNPLQKMLKCVKYNSF